MAQRLAFALCGRQRLYLENVTEQCILPVLSLTSATFFHCWPSLSPSPTSVVLGRPVERSRRGLIFWKAYRSAIFQMCFQKLFGISSRRTLVFISLPSHGSPRHTLSLEDTNGKQTVFPHEQGSLWGRLGFVCVHYIPRFSSLS